jgi:methionyl-tRNA formyltransferase
MRIVFIGSVLFSKAALEKLIELKADIVGVICKKESSFNADFFDLGVIANDHSIQSHYTEDINSSNTVEWISQINPDIIFCFGWSQLLKKDILTIPTKGVVGFHPAALPFNRGRHPLIWALFLDLQKTASTFFFMDEHADTGPILSQSEILISDADDASTLYKKVADTALTQIEEFLPKLINNDYETATQKSGSGNTWRKRGKPDGEIDWRMSSRAIYNLVRALTKPYVGAHCLIKEKEYKIWKTEIVDDEYENIQNIEPGKVLKMNCESSTVDVKTYDGAIRILKHEINDLDLLGNYLK